MKCARRPHILGVDDGPFQKGQLDPVPLVAVMTEGADLCEGVAITSFPVDGEGATEFLATWIEGLRRRPSLQALVVGGITIAGLGVVDIEMLSRALAIPVLVVNRRDPRNDRVQEALETAGLGERMKIVERTPPAFALEPGLHLTHAGVERAAAAELLRASRSKSKFPEALRLAHLIARALVLGESRGRV